MNIEKKHIDINNLINLASFEVSEKEKESFSYELEEFLEYAKIINNAPINNTEPISHAVEKEILFRDDIEKNWNKLELILQNAPLKEDTSYIVPPQKGRTGKEKESHDKEHYKVIGEEYESVIGLEVHAQLKTNSKLFCRCSTEFGKKPNNNTCPVCSGQPGVLPVLNKKAVNMTILAGIAMNCSINKRSVFARKNYFYPDLPKGYQISQFEESICSNGFIDIEINNRIKRIKLNRIHIEEDAGKLVHVGAPGIWGAKASAVDFNRSSVPLIEIVSEPDLSSGREAKEYVVMLRAILVSLGICDGNMEEGSLRCDANISIRKKGEIKLGVKVEVKNMNSFKAIERAIDFEKERQINLIKSGNRPEQSTRLWDESSQKTYLMRTKEESQDYRYFPDPDLLPLILDIEQIKNKVIIMPLERKKKYIENYQLNEDQARLFMINPDYAGFFEETLKHYNNPRNSANWFCNELLSYISGDIKNIPITSKDFGEFLKRIDNEEISGKIGKDVIKKAFESKKSLNAIIKELGLKQITDQKIIDEIVERILKNNKKEVELYKKGKINLFGFFVGLVMKESKGHANPKIVNDILKAKLDKN